MEDYDYFQRLNSIQGMNVIGTDRFLLLDFDNKNYQKIFEKEFGTFEIAGLYLLINTDTKEIYVGESTNVKKRNEKELKKGLDNKKMKDWKFDKIILIWDGRPNTTSPLGEDSLRKRLEKFCIQEFQKEGEPYKCVNSVSKPKPTNFQAKTNVQKYFDEHILLLLKKRELINS